MPEPAQFLMVEGDQLIYCQGRLAWYFQAGNGLYWVTRPEFFASLPSVDQLLMLRIQAASANDTPKSTRKSGKNPIQKQDKPRKGQFKSDPRAKNHGPKNPLSVNDLQLCRKLQIPYSPTTHQKLWT
jgi:hypothetical protein